MKKLKNYSLSLFLVFLILSCAIEESLNGIEILGNAPNAFNLTSVGNGATDVNRSPILTWTRATDDDGDLVVYDLYLDDKQNPTTLIAQDIRITNYQLQVSLARAQKYYWKVIARDVSGKSTPSNEIFSFTTLNSGYQYSLVTGSASFSSRALHTMMSFDNKLWVVGGWINNGTQAENDVWYSNDGSSWLQATSNAPFRERYGHTSVVFNNKMWVIGGAVPGVGVGTGIQSDVWNTSDGVNWSLINDFAPNNFGHASVVFDNKIWAIGGSLHRVQYTTDGTSWSTSIPTLDPPFTKRYYHSVTVFDNKLWLIGGSNTFGTVTVAKKDIWYSADGENWTLVTNNAPFGERYGHTSAFFDNKLWVIGGIDGNGVTKNDIWYSTDGSNWVQVTTNASALHARYAQAHTIFQNKLWISGGNNSGFFKNDVWTME